MSSPSEHKVLVERRFKSSFRSGEEGESSLIWQDLASEPVVVVLGDPGAGKSAEFEREASRTSGAFLSIREFLWAGDQAREAGPLFLDALDETRASGGDQNAILTQVIQKLIGLGRPQVRLSCRAADWFGDLDRDELARLSPSGKVRVVELQPLDKSEVEQIVRAHLEDPSAFMEMARRQGLEGWLGNPQTLKMMIEVAREGALPETRTELFEKACALMAQEENRRHRIATRQDPIGKKEILEAAGFLCAVALTAGLVGFAADRAKSDSDFPSLDNIPGSQKELKAAIGSRLFRWQEGRAIPVHRTIAEFLAARTLRDRISKGLPLARVLRLITGHDGGTLSDLRGLFAWLTSLTPEHASELAARDPVALIFYGDPAPLPPLVKRVVLGSLEKLALEDPWFFYEGGSAQPFGRLSDPALIPDLHAALLEPDRSIYFRLTVLAIVAYGRPLPELEKVLRGIVYDRSSPQGIRELALRALINVVSEGTQLLSLLSLLQDIHADVVLDEQDSLRADLLEKLYPQVINPEEVALYLSPRKATNYTGRYYFFLTRLIGSKTLHDNLPDLLDALSDPESWRGHRGDRAWKRMIGPLLRRGLEIHGGSVPVARLWSWLRVTDRGVRSALEREDELAVQCWFSERPQRVSELYQWCVQDEGISESALWDREFWKALCDPERPSDLWRWQLAAAESWADEERGRALLGCVVSAVWSKAVGPTLEELFATADRNPSLAKTLEPLLTCPLYIDPEVIKLARSNEDDEAAITTQTQALMQVHLEAIRAGEEVGLLEYLACLFLESSTSTDKPTGVDRITERFGSEIAEAATAGFLAILGRLDLPTPEQIGAVAVRQEFFHVCLPLVAGVILLQEKGTLPLLQDSLGLRAALAFEFTQGINGYRWFDAIIRREPAVAAGVIEEAWSPFLKKNVTDVRHLYRIDQDSTLTLIAREIGLSLLKSYPRSSGALLGALMRAALVGTSREALASFVATRTVQLRGLKGDSYITWLAVALLLTPDAGLKRIRTLLRRREPPTVPAQRLLHFLEEFNGIGGYSLFDSTASALAELVGLLGAIIPPKSLDDSEDRGLVRFKAARFVGNLIVALGNRVDEEAACLLRNLRDNHSLDAWKETLSNAIEQQRRKVREQRYLRPSLPEVLKVLDGGEPISPGDLYAIVCEHLKTLISAIERGPESGYRAFWNVGARGVLESPAPENEGRNRLRGLLNTRLLPGGISAEIEGHYSSGNRSDLKIVFGSMNIPVEIKRHYHRDVWTAPRAQLRKKYSMDPGADGFGVYIVFWFGETEKRRLPAPPVGIARPKTAAELESALGAFYSGEEWRNTEFFCIDCSKRETTKKKRTGTKRS